MLLASHKQTKLSSKDAKIEYTLEEKYLLTTMQTPTCDSSDCMTSLESVVVTSALRACTCPGARSSHSCCAVHALSMLFGDRDSGLRSIFSHSCRTGGLQPLHLPPAAGVRRPRAGADVPPVRNRPQLQGVRRSRHEPEQVFR